MEWNKLNEDSNLTQSGVIVFFERILQVKSSSECFPSSTFAFGKKVNFPYKNYIVQKLGGFIFSISIKYGHLDYNTCIGIASNGTVIATTNNNHYLLNWYVIILAEMV